MLQLFLYFVRTRRFEIWKGRYSKEELQEKGHSRKPNHCSSFLRMSVANHAARFPSKYLQSLIRPLLDYWRMRVPVLQFRSFATDLFEQETRRAGKKKEKKTA